MAEVAEMGEVDEMHSNEDGVLLNGDVTKDVEMENRDIEMENKNIEEESITVNKIPQEEIATDVSMDSKDVSMDSKDVSMDSKDVDMEETGSQSAADEDSQDSQDSQEDKSQGSPESQDQDSSMEPEQINEENTDTNTNSSLPHNEEVSVNCSEVPNEETNENSNVSSKKNDDENSRSSTGEANEATAHEEDPLFNENSQGDNIESHKKSQSEDQDQEVSRDGSETKSESAKNEPSENGTEDRAPSAASSVVSAQEVHEIEDDKAHETIELNESEDDGDVMIVDTPKTNGTTEVIDLIDTTPEKKVIDSKELKEVVTPRRSSRNLNKSKSYVESDKEDTPPPPPVEEEEDSEESDIEEILPQDPLAVNDQITVERIPSVKKPAVSSDKSATIVVNDTKRLVEIASKSNQNSSTPQQGKKEPTLVIIDTNSILSGRGPVPVPAAAKPNQTVTVTAPNFNSMLPVAVPAQGMYPANMRATITPIPVNTMSMTTKSSPIITSMQQGAPLLPTLTDDMFVVEAPSFIVPYVYEKPPVKILKDFVGDIKKQIQDAKAKEKQERKEEKEKKKKEKKEKEEKDSKKEKDTKKDDGDDTDATYSSEEESEEEKEDLVKKPYSYFDSPLGKFFIDIGTSMVQEYVQTDLLKQQKRKRDREQGANPETNKTIVSLIKNIEMSKENNGHFKMAVKKCEFCNFKTESKLVMAYHLETPHMKNFVYKCNFCSYEVRSPHDILFHMEAEHAVRGHLERAPAFHQCPSCPFEDNQKGKLSRHLVVCARKFKPDRNLEPPPDWEPPAKIPRMPKMRATGLNATVAAYQTLAANKGAQQYQFLSKMQLQANAASSAINRGRGRPTLGPNVKTQPIIRPQGMIFKQQTGGQVLVPANYQLGGNQVFQNAQVQQAAKKPSNTPSISITPLPRGTSATPAMASKPGDTNSKNSFVICEICDGYIKDLEQLRNHMQWIHKIKIHPKMIYNRPPLNCQKCQFRFFTDQGLERHLLGSHGLVTSSMQDAANKSKDSGRCPVCGRVYQWKLLNHVARDHNMTLKPAHLSYKCTVCTATFGMYKQFENHVYSAHSVVAKRVMDKKSTSASPSAAKSTDMKPLKINDEITIIPQPAKSTNGASKEGSPAPKNTPGTSKNEEESSSITRAERLARRNAVSTDSD